MRKTFDAIEGLEALTYNISSRFYGLYLTQRRAIKYMKFSSGDKIIDIGCGSGYSLSKIDRFNDSVNLIGVDVSSDILKLARKRKFKNMVVLEIANALDLPYSDQSFDCAIITYTLHHIPIQELNSIFEELSRVVKKEGRVYVLDFGKPTNWIGRLKKWIILENHSYTSEYLKTPLNETLKGLGFNVKLIKVFGGVNYLIEIKL